MKFLHKIAVFLLLTAGAFLSAAGSILPPGAVVDWSYRNAWKRSGETDFEVCLNGLWRFRTENRWKKIREEKLLFHDPVEEDSPKERFVLIPGKNIQIKKSFDTVNFRSGKSSVRFDLDIGKVKNLYHLSFRIKGLPVRNFYTLKFDYCARLEGDDYRVELQDPEDFRRYCQRLKNWKNDGQWHTASIRIFLPEKSRTLAVVLPRSQSGNLRGKLWIDNIRVVEELELPVSDLSIPEKSYGYAAVPGSIGKSDLIFPHPDDPGRKNLKKNALAWYSRTFELPEEYRDHRIFLYLKRIATDAVVYCNGKKMGRCGFTGGRIDLTDAVKPGKNQLAILVHARNNWDVAPGFYRSAGDLDRAGTPDCGIMGDVFLTGTGKNAPELGKPVIRTGISPEKKLFVEVPVRKTLPPGTTYLCRILQDGKPVKTFSGKAVPEDGKITFSGKWNGARLWDIDRPQLYELDFALFHRGKLLRRILPETFGFRTFEIRGRDFYLNDVKIHLNPCSYWGDTENRDTRQSAEHFLTRIKAAGYNFVYLRQNHVPGRMDCVSGFLEICDRLGLLCAITPMNIKQAWRDFDAGNRRRVWDPIVRHTVRETINHPALVMWRMNMNLNCYEQDQNPLFLDGKKSFDPGSPEQRKEDVMLLSNAFVRALDPSRPIYNHACGKTGDVYNLNNYLGHPEMQDLREYLKHWAANGIKPLFMAEHAIPYPGDFQLRDPNRWLVSEPLITEYGAIYLGEKAYELEDPEYVSYLEKGCKNNKYPQNYYYFWKLVPEIVEICTQMSLEVIYPYWRAWGISGGINLWENSWRRMIRRPAGGLWPELPKPVKLSVDYQNLQKPGRAAALWHYSGGSGGELRTLYDLDREEEKAYFQPTGRKELLARLMAEQIAFIGGPAEAWWNCGHAFYSGEQVEKSLILINDARREQAFEAEWKLLENGKAVRSGKSSLVVGPAQKGVLPLRFTLPAAAEKRALELTAVVRCGKKNIPVKSFAMQVFPPLKTFPMPEKTVLFDAGEKMTTRLLRQRNVVLPTVSQACSSLPPDTRLLVIGSLALDELDENAPLWKQALPRALKNGTNVLIMSQSSRALKKFFNFRSFTPAVRTVWIRTPDHPVLRGMENVSFRDWRGSSSLAKPDPAPGSLGEKQRPRPVWRCSQEGVVASTVVEKPHNIPFLPLLDTGFDLRYTVLFEVPAGKGKWIFSQLDLAGRSSAEPAADQLLERLFCYGTASSGTAASGVLTLDRGTAKQQLQDKEKIARFLLQGGTVLALGLDAGDGKTLAEIAGKRFNVSTAVNHLNRFDGRGRIPECFRGLSAADLRWRKPLECAVVQNLPPDAWGISSGTLAMIPAGRGKIVWFSALPQDFEDPARKDLVFSRVKTARLLQILRANLGEYDRFPLENPYADTREERDDPYANMRW